jgi:hypothetical protein
MKLSYKLSGGSYVLLADESDRVTTLELAAPSFSRQVQVEALVRAESVTTFDRLNVSVELPITATISYATTVLALASVATMAALFSGRVHLKLEQGATVLYFPNAVLQGYTPELTGVTVRHSFNFITQQVTTVAP